MHTIEKRDDIYDFIAVGVGPFNLGLACLTEPISDIKSLFLDQRDRFDWHPGMLLQETTLQIPFLADLVTLADPTNPFSFLKYLKEQGRIYSFYIRENFLVLRNEYNLYCQWAVRKLKNVRFQSKVVEIFYDKGEKCYTVRCLDTKTNDMATYKTAKLVLGTGTKPFFPEVCGELQGDAIHSSSYLSKKEILQAKESITIVGSGQSAAEIFYDLLQEIETKGYELHWITRSPRFFPLEYTKLTLEMTSPEYVDYFYRLSPEKKEALLKNQKGLFKGINQELIAAIFDLIYTKKLLHPVSIHLRTNAELQKATYDLFSGQYHLEFYQHEQEKRYQHQTAGLVLATGYSYRTPTCIAPISNRIRWDSRGRYEVARNYTIDKGGKEIFVQNAELHTHGFVTPDLGMACYRNSYILKEITGKEYYPIEKRIAFQQFEVGREEEVHAVQTR